MAKATVSLVTITAMCMSSCSSSQPIALTDQGNGKQQSTPQETVAPRVLPGLPFADTGGFDGSRAASAAGRLRSNALNQKSALISFDVILADAYS